MIGKLSKAWPGILLGLLVLAGLVLLRGYDPAVMTAMRNAGFDGLQRVWPRQVNTSLPVRIVDIDEASLAKLGQWPWPRTLLAQLVDELGRLGAAVVAFDIIFPEPDRLSPSRIVEDPALIAVLDPELREKLKTTLSDNDAVFAKSIGQMQVVLAFANAPGSARKEGTRKTGFAQTGLTTLKAPPPIRGIAANIPVLETAASGIGGINLDLGGEQGVARQIPMLWTDGKDFYPSLVLEALRVAQGAGAIIVNGSEQIENVIDSIRVGDFEMPVAENSLFAIHYRPESRETYVSAYRIISGEERAALAPSIEGHIVFVGTSSAGLLDSRVTSLGTVVPGVSIHAQALEQILTGSFLTRPDWAAGAEILALILLGLAVVLIAMLWTPLAGTLAGLVSIGLFAGASVYAFRSLGVLFDATFPAAALILTAAATLAFRLLITDKDRRMLRNAFGHFVSSSVLAEIERNPAALKLGGEVREVTVMFVDIRNFTPLSEKLAPETLVSVVNTLLDRWSDAIIAEGGTIDKYIGDAIMAFWNAPVARADHQYHAACAALGIRRALAKINEEEDILRVLKPAGMWPLRNGVGISTGPACVGNMGSKERFDYSVVGETVNVAARAESASKAVGFDIVVTGKLDEATRKLATLEAGSVAMKGKSTSTPLTVIVGDEALATSTPFAELKALHDDLAGALRMPGQSKIDDMASACRSRATLLEPLLDAFYERIAARGEDFSGAQKAEA
jgi:adenylate cyclase